MHLNATAVHFFNLIFKLQNFQNFIMQNCFSLKKKIKSNVLLEEKERNKLSRTIIENIVNQDPEKMYG